MVVRLARIQHHQQEVRRLADGNDLAPTACVGVNWGVKVVMFQAQGDHEQSP